MRQRWARAVGFVTTYRLVALCLSALGMIALAMSLLGIGAFTPLELISSAAVAIAATGATSVVLARMMRVSPHLDSAAITALLVFFIMEPTLDPVGLTGIAIAGTLANASKYLIAFRGRHILNPAALGVFGVGLVAATGFTGLGYAVWWLGSSVYFVPVALAAVVVLDRTNRLAIGLTFIALVAAGSALYFLAVGETPWAGVQFALVSGPTIFFAGFMLTEPLTLPPRRWQQLLEVVVVALLFIFPFMLGPITRTPQLALLAGNLIGFAFGQRRGIRMTYMDKTAVNATTWELAFQPSRPVRFEPGQFMQLTISHRTADFRGSRRYFTISSAPTIDGPLTFAITTPARTSSFKKALLELTPGAIVHGTSVGGDFVLPKHASEPLLLIAGGIGITPFASQLAHATARGEKRDIVVVYATSAQGELPYAGLLKRSAARVVLFAPDAPAPLPSGWLYAGADRVTGAALALAVPDIATRLVFLSGPPALVGELRTALRRLGARRVRTDYFTGY